MAATRLESAPTRLSVTPVTADASSLVYVCISQCEA